MIYVKFVLSTRIFYSGVSDFAAFVDLAAFDAVDWYFFLVYVVPFLEQ